jgi:hypothetical protein
LEPVFFFLENKFFAINGNFLLKDFPLDYSSKTLDLIQRIVTTSLPFPRYKYVALVQTEAYLEEQGISFRFPTLESIHELQLNREKSQGLFYFPNLINSTFESQGCFRKEALKWADIK